MVGPFYVTEENPNENGQKKKLSTVCIFCMSLQIYTKFRNSMGIEALLSTRRAYQFALSSEKTTPAQKCNLNGMFHKITELQTNGRERFPFLAAFSSLPPTGRSRAPTLYQNLC